VFQPRILPVPGHIVKISAGDDVSAALDDGGRAYVWGRNDQGQLGLGHRNDVLTPTRLPGLYQDVVVGSAHILAISK
jgi:alpha-tubulin suppressor-like RCC1 family protein